AAEFGIADLVDEHPDRVPYLDALSLLLDSDALLVVGSVEPHYTASKIFPYILAARPLLTIFHEQSSVVRIMEDTHAGEVITFGDGRPLNAIIEEISESFRCLLALPRGFTPVTRWETFGPYTTRAMAARLAAVFDEIVRPGKNADSPSGRVGSQRPQSGKAEND